MTEDSTLSANTPSKFLSDKGQGRESASSALEAKLKGYQAREEAMEKQLESAIKQRDEN